MIIKNQNEKNKQLVHNYILDKNSKKNFRESKRKVKEKIIQKKNRLM